MIDIISNGSKWYGEQPDNIEKLCEVLKTETLDPMFEWYGNFVNRHPHWLKEETAEKYAGCVSIFGNFTTYSHVFNIVTDETAVINLLEGLIRANQKTEEYQHIRRRVIV